MWETYIGRWFQLHVVGTPDHYLSQLKLFELVAHSGGGSQKNKNYCLGLPERSGNKPPGETFTTWYLVRSLFSLSILFSKLNKTKCQYCQLCVLWENSNATFYVQLLTLHPRRATRVRQFRTVDRLGPADYHRSFWKMYSQEQKRFQSKKIIWRRNKFVFLK